MSVCSDMILLTESHIPTHRDHAVILQACLNHQNNGLVTEDGVTSRNFLDCLHLEIHYAL